MADIPPLPWSYQRTVAGHDVVPDAIEIVSEPTGAHVATVTGPGAFRIAAIVTSDRVTCEMLEGARHG